MEGEVIEVELSLIDYVQMDELDHLEKEIQGRRRGRGKGQRQARRVVDTAFCDDRDILCTFWISETH